MKQCKWMAVAGVVMVCMVIGVQIGRADVLKQVAFGGIGTSTPILVCAEAKPLINACLAQYSSCELQSYISSSNSASSGAEKQTVNIGSTADSCKTTYSTCTTLANKLCSCVTPSSNSAAGVNAILNSSPASSDTSSNTGTNGSTPQNIPDSGNSIQGGCSLIR